MVCGDINHNVLNPTITNFFHHLGLCHKIFSKHDPAGALATYACNQRNISIDGVWGPYAITMIKGGYLDFDDFPGDHRAIWFDLPYDQIFGHTLPPTWHPQVCRLQLCDPQCVMHYNKLFKAYLLSHNLPEALFSLKADLIHQPPTAAHCHEANRIDSLTTQGQLYAQA